MKLLKFVLLPSVVLALAACSTTKTDPSTDSAREKVAEANELARVGIINAEKNRIASQDVRRPYIAGNSRPLAREVSMPEILRRSTPITALVSRTPVDLLTAAQQLSEAADITISVTPDALLPASSFVPKISTTAAASPVQAPTRVVLQAVNQPLWKTLDDVARQASVSWRPVNGGAEFYRVETRVFYLSAIAQSATTSASLGRNAGSNTAFDSQSKSSFELKEQNLIKGITTTVDAMLSVSGKVTPSQENQNLIVTDTKDALDRVDAYIKEQNKIMSRRVRVLIEAVEVVDKDSSEVGVDWSIIYKTAADSLAVTPIANLASAQAGSLALGNTSGNNTTSILVKALNEIGTVVNRRTFPLSTTSGRPVTQALRSTFNYIDQVQTNSVASSAANTVAAPTVQQKDETVGTFLTIVPTAKSDGTVFLNVSYDVTNLTSLVPFTTGSGSSSVTVQQKTIDGSGLIEEVPVRAGRTVVIGGIETMTNQATQRRIASGASIMFGGSDVGKVTKSRMILLATAVIEEGI